MRRLLAFLAAFVVLTGVALAQDEKDRVREREITAAGNQLARLSNDLADDGVDDPREFERDVRKIIEESRKRLAPVEESLRRAEDSLLLLGSVPKEGEAPEAAAVTRERDNLNNRISYLRGQKTRILAAIDEGGIILGELSKRRLRDLYRNVVKRETPLIAPSLWSASSDEGRGLAGAFGRFFAAWSDKREGEGGAPWSLAGFALAFLASFLLSGPVREWMRRVFAARIEAHEPTSARRVAAAGINMLTRIIPGIIGGLIVIETSRALGLLGEEGVPVANAIWIALVAFLLVDGFTGGLFAPSAPAWRLAPIEAAKGKRASALLVAIVIVVGVKSVFMEVARVAGETGKLGYAITGAASVIVGGLLFVLCEKRLWSKAEAPEKISGDEKAQETDANGIWPVVRFFGRVLGTLIMAAAIAGHVNLADFASTRLYYFALLLAVAWFIRAAMKETAGWADYRLRAGHGGSRGKDEGGTFQLWFGAGIDFALLLLAAPVLFVLAGVEWGAVRDFFFRALVGFRVGGVVISLSDIFMAIAAFVAILLLTRLLQGAMQRGPLAHSRIDPGIQNSLTTLFGYLGLVIAAVVGLGMVGVDLSNLALIAGALSVGIGFGLQSIVNNFVSGLILLFERPIKVGDWIVTTSGEGIVKKISVRSTELETFDRAAIIIPNSELVASTVTNWTHKSALGRIRVSVGVSYDADPELVREVLLKCANEHPLIVRYPEPFVVWQEFGASSLDFEVRAFISDISKGLQVRTDLRYKIFKAFKEKGIEIPFPQQDVHIKSVRGASAFPARQDASGKIDIAERHQPEKIDAPDD